MKDWFMLWRFAVEWTISCAVTNVNTGRLVLVA
jgi:hypothetical protein